MKVRFLHNRKASVINTEQIFIGLSWQYAISSLPLLNRNWKLQGQTQQENNTKAVTERWYEEYRQFVNSDIRQVRQRRHVVGSSQLFEVLWQTIWCMLFNDRPFSLVLSIADALVSPWGIPEHQMCDVSLINSSTPLSVWVNSIIAF